MSNNITKSNIVYLLLPSRSGSEHTDYIWLIIHRLQTVLPDKIKVCTGDSHIGLNSAILLGITHPLSPNPWRKITCHKDERTG